MQADDALHAHVIYKMSLKSGLAKTRADGPWALALIRLDE